MWKSTFLMPAVTREVQSVLTEGARCAYFLLGAAILGHHHRVQSCSVSATVPDALRPSTVRVASDAGTRGSALPWPTNTGSCLVASFACAALQA